MRHWILLIIAGLLEIVWAVALKYANGFTKFFPSAVSVVGMGLSVAFLSLAIRKIPLGTGYAIWTGIGAVGTYVASVVLFGESSAPLRLACVALIVCGMVGLKLLS